MLLSGSVIGGVEDLGAVYYNPGRLALIENPAFLLSASVYEYSAVSFENLYGTSRNASKSDIKGVPTLAAGTFKVKFLPKDHFAYAVMTRQSSDLGFGYHDETYGNVLDSLPGDEYFGAEVSITQKYLEQWIGITWSRALSDRFSLGVTTNFSTNNQSRGGSIDLQALASNGEVAVLKQNRNISYKQSGFLWKVGLAGDLGKWNLGLTVTTPVVPISGQGSYNYEFFFSKVSFLNRPEIYTTSYQDGLEIKLKTPWSVGFGASRAIGKSKLHVSTEWYSAIPKYTLMQATAHTSQSNPNDTIRFSLVDDLRSVWNVGAGAEIYINEKISGFVSYSTDFSALTNNFTRFLERKPEASNSSWNADFYHFGGGIVLKLKGADITLGATHTGASQLIQRPVNFPDNASQSIFSSTDQATVNWDRWRFVFSFSLPFLKDYANKLKGEGDGEK